MLVMGLGLHHDNFTEVMRVALGKRSITCRAVRS